MKPPYHPTYRARFRLVFILSAVVFGGCLILLLAPPLQQAVASWTLGNASTTATDLVAIIALTILSVAHLVFAPLLAFVYWPKGEGSKKREASLPLEG